jgi:S-methylmethionine-dependent homocysteine/selenocysteine methylase
LLLGNHCFSGVVSGDYGEAGTLEFLKDFHKRRLEVLAEAGPDLIAFETIPNKLEAQVCYSLLLTPGIFCLSFNNVFLQNNLYCFACWSLGLR